MKKTYIYVAVFLIVILACSNRNNMENGNWNIIRTSGIDPENSSLEYMCVLNDKIGIILGSSYADNDMLSFDRYKATIYSSSDNGRNWNALLNLYGTFTSYAVKDSAVYVSLGINKQDRTATFMDSSKLYFSNNSGKKWLEIAKFNDFLINSIFPVSNNELYILGRSENDDFWRLRKAVNNMNEWKDVSKISLRMFSPVFTGHQLWFLNEGTERKLARMSLPDSKIEFINLPKEGFNPYLITGFKNDILIAGVTETPLVYKYNVNTNTYETVIDVKIKGAHPAYLTCYGDKIMLLLGRGDKIGTSYFIYSKDIKSGSWSLEELPVSYFKPFAFLKNQIWGYNDGLLYKKSL